MSQYFKFFPKIQYPYEGKMVGDSRTKISTIECSDLGVRHRIKQEVLTNPLSYYTYTWKDTDRPDIVAFTYYGSTDYTWVVLLSAEVFDYLHDFPMRSEVFLEYLKDRYEVIDPYSLEQVVHHYEDGEGFVIDLETFQSIPDPAKKIVSVFQFEFNENERRRKVKLLSRKFLTQLTEEYERTMKSIKEIRRVSLAEFIMNGGS